MLGRGTGPMHLQIEGLHAEHARTDRLLLRGLCFVIVDEADRVLVDEARTPLIISNRGDSSQEEQLYSEAITIAPTPAPRSERLTDILGDRCLRRRLLVAGERLAVAVDHLARGAREGDVEAVGILVVNHAVHRYLALDYGNPCGVIVHRPVFLTNDVEKLGGCDNVLGKGGKEERQQNQDRQEFQPQYLTLLITPFDLLRQGYRSKLDHCGGLR
jgi:hypothetical protein